MDHSIKEIMVLLGGLHAVAFAIFHSLFWKLFHWKSDLKKVSYVNRAIIQILNLRLIYFFLLVALICFLFSKELLQSRLGNFFLGGISLFWLGRTIEQFIFLNIHDARVHLLTAAFILGAVLFFIPLVM